MASSRLLYKNSVLSLGNTLFLFAIYYKGLEYDNVLLYRGNMDFMV